MKWLAVWSFTGKLFASQTQKTIPEPKNLQPSDFLWDALTIELPRLRWQREGYDVYWFVRGTYSTYC